MKELINKIGTFCINRLAELVGILVILVSIFIFISLVTYSPEDPNFIISEVKEINNILGTKGSYVSDLFVQSIGMISILVSFSFLFTGIKLILFFFKLEHNSFPTKPSEPSTITLFTFCLSNYRLYQLV